ncbi:MAG: hypothetical protein KJ060_00530, partial [Candidatus Hydrogenedentes bacterium]|nr:hypothetical protein [Candidatus Hydrogenedentota bacterium]
MSTYDNIRSKIERADQHIQELDQAIREFMNNKPFRIVTKQDKNTGEHIMVIADARPIPAEWSILAGEAVHQLRSSLDHAICYMVERAGGKVTKRTQFPISTAKRADILKREEASMEGIPEVAAQVVRQFQPYVVFDPYDFYEHPLNVLRELSNTDKHRSLNLINLVSPEAKIKVGSSIRDC